MSSFQATFPHKDSELEPILSAETVSYHYGKHHCGYAKKLGALLENTLFADQSLDEIIVQSRGKNPQIFNNAAQLFNHDFYWKCLKISTAETPPEPFRSVVVGQFGSFEDFANQYAETANAMFASGWSWLIWENGKLSFINTANAETIPGTAAVAVCVIDLWEHAYYIDYRHDRALYISKIIRNGLNWEFCNNIVANQLATNSQPGDHR
ncbi:MAG: superoxide dismutase [Holosporaceae bacterium]|nr:superoxide dismutase [Holosporaceae bacterium]